MKTETWLACTHPGCGCTDLHFLEAIVTYREPSEDGPSKESRIQADGKAQAGRDCRSNPSSRRGAVVLCFTCEWSEHITRIVFQQHKGRTFVEGLELTEE